MRSSASTIVTAQFLSSILAARRTPMTELAETIAVVTETVSNLVAGVAPPPPVKVRPARSVSVKQTAAASPVVMETEEPEEPEIIVLPPRRRRGRPPLVRVEATEPEVVVEEVAPTPRLLRRAEVQQAPVISADPFETDRVNGHDLHVKGVVKWFDTRTNKGVLRLVGMAGDIPLDSAILTNSRVKRLFKDQEVDVLGDYLDGQFHPKTLSIPGQTQANLLTGGEVLTAGNRQSRPVLVEVKRVHPRFQSARAEAEYAFGKITSKSTS